MPERILQILAEEEAVYREVDRLVRAKQKALVDRDTDQVAVLTKEEETQIEVINRLEKERMEVVSEMAASLGKAPDEIRSKEIETLLGPEKGKTFREIVDRLKALLESIREVNELNTKLLMQSLDVINYTLRVLSSLETRIGGYGKSGEGQAPKASGPSPSLTKGMKCPASS